MYELTLFSNILQQCLYFFFRTHFFFDGQNYQKQKGPRTSEQSLFKLQNKFRKIPLLVIYYLTKLIM